MIDALVAEWNDGNGNPHVSATCEAVLKPR